MLDFEVGEVIAERYEIKKVLGAGGMGKVYRAKQLDLGRDVALKVPSEAVLQNPDIMARFIREAKTVARLTHENVVQIYDYDVKQDMAYIAMEFVEGKDLKEFVAKQTPGLTVGDMAKILQLSCEGIQHAHDHGIIHRDIKPHNIMVAALGRGRWRVKVMDFGIAHLDSNSQFTDMGDGQLTQTGQALGTPSYMSPEQIRGAEINVGTDIYSFGCVMYYCFTRQTVFTGSGLTVAVAHLNERPPSLRARVPGLPHELDQLIMRCLEKEASRRPTDISAVGDEIISILQSCGNTPMEQIWAEGLQAPDANIPIIAAPEADASGGTGGKLVEVQTQETLAMTDSPTGPAAEATVPAGRLGEAPMAPGTNRPADPDATIPAQKPATMAAASTAAAPPTTGGGPSTTATPAPAPQNKVLLMIGGVAAVFIVVGVILSFVIGGGEDPPLADGPAIDVAETDGPIIPEVTPGIPTAEDDPVNGEGGTEVAVVMPPVPTPERSPTATPAPVATPTATPQPTATPEPTPTPDLRRNAVQNLFNRARDTNDVVTRIRTWEQIMEQIDPNDEVFNELVLNYADQVAMLVVRSPEMVSVNGGRFTMGNDQGRDDERPERNVILSDYELGKYEVTALEFATFLNADKDLAPTLFSPSSSNAINVVLDDSIGRYRPRQGRALHPANGVSWVAANAYARWVAEETGRLYRLPTEAEWERAARGTTQNRYPWGDTVASATLANFNRPQGTMEVNTMNDGTGFTGMHHLAGNVAEWCLDWFARDYYAETPNIRDPRGPNLEGTRQDRRVVRGGSFMDQSPDALESSRRNRLRPEDQDPSVGFRLALGTPQ